MFLLLRESSLHLTRIFNFGLDIQILVLGSIQSFIVGELTLETLVLEVLGPRTSKGSLENFRRRINGGRFMR